MTGLIYNQFFLSIQLAPRSFLSIQYRPGSEKPRSKFGSRSVLGGSRSVPGRFWVGPVREVLGMFWDRLVGLSEGLGENVGDVPGWFGRCLDSMTTFLEGALRIKLNRNQYKLLNPLEKPVIHQLLCSIFEDSRVGTDTARHGKTFFTGPL